MQFLTSLSQNNTFFSIVVTIGLGLMAMIFLNHAIGFFFGGLSEKSRLSFYKNRIQTIQSLSENIAYLAIFLVCTLMILAQLGVNTTPILTGAGLLGLAVSFGAQTLVRDIIAGFFIIIENQYNVGNNVQIGAVEGKVRAINLRTTVLEDKKGNRIFIPNSEIKQVIVLKKHEKKDTDKKRS